MFMSSLHPNKPLGLKSGQNLLKVFSTLILSYLCLMFSPIASATKYASIGDYGTSNTPEQNVANLVNGWNPEFIVTNGDNTYNGSYSSSQTPYLSWQSGTCASSSRFFPSFGNHDNSSGYRSYFGNTCEQYSVRKGDIEFFTFNSNNGSPGTSIRTWLENGLRNSTATWKIVFFHHSAYSSCRHGSNSSHQHPYAAWGVDVVFSGHDHCYERIERGDGVVYFVNGLGGRSPYSFGGTVSGSQIRYNSNNGAMLVETTPTTWHSRFYTHTGVLIDEKRISKGPGGGNTAPTAAFTSNSNGLSVSFSDGSSDPDGSIASRSWNFGDGSSSTATNPSHTYNSAGLYSVTLTVTDNEGATDSVTQSVSASAPGSGTVGITEVLTHTSGPSTHNTRRTMGFTMSSAGQINSIATHHVGGSGNIMYGLYADSSNSPGALLGKTSSTSTSSSTGWQTINLQSPVNVASGTKVWLAWVFSANPGISYRNTNTGEQGRFASTQTFSSGMPSNYGSATESAFIYSVYANYSSSTGPVNIPPNAAFTVSTNNLVASFTDGSSDPDGSIVSRSWNFGDGGTSSSTNPNHTYGSAGTYTVTLTVSDNDGASDSASQSITLSAANVSPNAAFTVSTNGLSASFNDGSSDPDGSIASRAWNFGDGGTSSSTNPNHTYSSGGTYSVSLTVTDNNGATDVASQSVTVSGGGGGSTVLQNGVAKTGIAGTTSSNQSQYYTLQVPAGASNLNFETSGNNGDADLYVKFGSQPASITDYDCNSESSNSNETCAITNVQAGTYHVMVYAYANFSGLSLTGSYTSGGGGGSGNVGNVEVFTHTSGPSTHSNRRSMGFTMSEAGTINSMTTHHSSGSGNVIYGVYADNNGSPGALLGKTSSTSVGSSTGWHTINLESSVSVSSGQKVWLAWVFSSNPGISYRNANTGEQGRFASTQTFSSGMPSNYGSSTESAFVYSVYASYTN